MDRIININVSGNRLTKDSNKAGTRGEANVTTLRITFGESWDGYAKSVVFLDAHGLNPTRRTLTADLLENIEESTRIYLLPIPKEPMGLAGEMSFSIEGYVDGKRQRSVTGTLEVEDAVITDVVNDPTPTQMEEMQAQYESIMSDIQQTALNKTATEAYKTEAKNHADNAEASATNAAGYADDAEGYADEAKGYANNAEASATNANAAKAEAEQAAAYVSELKSDVEGLKQETIDEATVALENIKRETENALNKDAEMALESIKQETIEALNQEATQAMATLSKNTTKEVEALSQEAINDVEAIKQGAIAEVASIKEEAKTYADNAELYQLNAEAYAAYADGYANKAENALGKTNYIGENGNWYAWDSVKNAFYDTGVRAQSGSVVYVGDNPPSVADVWIESDGEPDDIISRLNELERHTGSIEVSETVVGDYSKIMMYDKGGNATTDFAKAHSGLFRVYVQQKAGSSVVQYGNEYLLMEQIVARTSGNTSANLVKQTILIGSKLLFRSFDHIANILTEDGEFINSCGDFNYIELASAANKEDVSNKSTVIDDTANDTKYPTTKAVKDYVDDAVEGTDAIDTKLRELFDGELLRRNYISTCQNGFTYSGGVGSSLKTVANEKRAIFSISSYCKDIFVMPKEGYMAIVYYLDENNVVTKVTYAANGITIPKNQIFAVMVYNNNNTTVMTDEEAKSVINIQNEEAKEKKRRSEGAFLDGKFSTIAYSHLVNESTIINTAEHYAVVGKTDGFDAIKGDIQITSDNKLVMCHDKGYTLDTDGRITAFDKNNCTLIRNMTYDQVVALEHAKQYEGAYVHPTGIDSLLKVCKRYGKFPYITIRDENMDVIAPILIEKIREYGLETHCIINSFTLSSLATVRQSSDYVFLSQVLQENQTLSQKVVDRINEYGNVVITMFDNDGSTIETNLEMMKHAKSRGIRIFGAVYSKTENIEKLVNNGFSGVQSYVPFE